MTDFYTLVLDLLYYIGDYSNEILTAYLGNGMIWHDMT